MRLYISGSGEDIEDKLVRFIIKAEDEDFKGTRDFYSYADIFNDFANSLLAFPFESNKEIKFEADGVNLTVSLKDGVGAIDLHIGVKDDERNSVEFTVTNLETMMLHAFAEKLKSTDFSQPNSEVIWDAPSKSRV